MRELLLFFTLMLLCVVPFFTVLRGAEYTRCVVYSWLANAMFCSISAAAIPPLLRTFSPGRADSVVVDPLGVIGFIVVSWILPAIVGIIALTLREFIRPRVKREA